MLFIKFVLIEIVKQMVPFHSRCFYIKFRDCINVENIIQTALWLYFRFDCVCLTGNETKGNKKTEIVYELHVKGCL